MSTATAVLDLEKAGFTREQVEALARFHEAQIDLSKLATKTDLQLLEQRLTIKLGLMLAAGVAIVGGLVALF